MRSAFALLAPLAAGVLALACLPAAATIYKCVTPEGKVTYRDAPCVVAPKPRPAEPAPAAEEPAVAEAAVATAATPGDAPATAAEAGSPAVASPTVADAAPASAAGSAAPLPSQPLRPREARSGNWFFFSVGLLLATVAYLVHIVVAFRGDQVGWGIALILLSPLSNLAYSLFHFRKTLAGWAVAIPGVAIMAVAYVPSHKLIDVLDSYTTANGSYDVDIRKPRTTFSLGQRVNLKTVLGWDDWSVETMHFAGWIWYANGVPAGNYMAPVRLDADNNVLVGYMPAESLGEGEHRVELYLDGALFDAREFRVVP